MYNIEMDHQVNIGLYRRLLPALLLTCSTVVSSEDGSFAELTKRAQECVEQVESCTDCNIEKQYSAAAICVDDTERGNSSPYGSVGPAIWLGHTSDADMGAGMSLPIYVGKTASPYGSVGPVATDFGRGTSSPYGSVGPVATDFGRGTSSPYGSVEDEDIEALTARFHEIHEQVRKGTANDFLEQSGGYRYLFVKGFMGNHISNYMEDQVSQLKQLNLNAAFIEIATEGDAEGNLAKIAADVRASDKPVILIGHSRGGMLIHDWYRLADPEMKEKVARLVLIQATVGGSPAADYVLDNWFLKSAAWLLGWLPSWGNVLETVRELSTAQRQQALARLPPLTANDLAKMYVLYTSFDPIKNTRYHTNMKIPWGFFEGRADEPRDGLVGVNEAKISGAHNIYLQDLDHEDTVIQTAGWFKRLSGSQPTPDYRVGDIAETIIRLILRQP